MSMKNHEYKPISSYPVMLRAEDVAAILRISRSKAYDLMHSEGFPTLRIGKHKLLVSKELFLAWIDSSCSKESA